MGAKEEPEGVDYRDCLEPLGARLTITLEPIEDSQTVEQGG